MAKKNPLPIDILRKLLSYNPETGALTWLPRSPEMFAGGRGRRSKEAIAKGWNTRYAGRPALNALRPDGYLTGSIFGQHYLAHQVCLALANGYWPQSETDHDNHVRSNNKFANLKSSSRLQNAKNHKLGKWNTSGCIGVHWNKQRQKWRARIWVGGKNRDLGSYARKEDAIFVVRVGYRMHGFHPNHGNPLTTES